MIDEHPTRRAQPWTAEDGTRWAAELASPARALAAARQGLAPFGLLPGFHTALARFEAAVRTDAAGTAPATVWTRQEGEMPSGALYATEAVARRRTAAAYADQWDTDEALLTWEHNGVHLELFDDGEPTDWILHEEPVTDDQEA